jgi:hypothetical protein
MPIEQSRVIEILDAAESIRLHHDTYTKQLQATLTGLAHLGGHIHTARIHANLDQHFEAYHEMAAAIHVLSEAINSDQSPAQPQILLAVERAYFDRKRKYNESAAKRQRLKRAMVADQQSEP